MLACALSDDCRHLLAAIGNGYVFRYEYRRPKAPAVTAMEEDPAADGNKDAISEGSEDG